MDHNTSRRRFLTNLAAAGALVPLMRVSGAYAAGLPHLSPSDANAKALHYTEDASKLTPKIDPIFKTGSDCGNCLFYKGGTAEWGACDIFPGKDVHIKGWCQSHAPKA